MVPKDSHTTMTDLKATVARFVKDREWERFHTPRNLAESICIESAELLEVFQWSDEDEAPTTDSPPMLKKLGETLGKTQPQEVLAAIVRPPTLENFIDVLERSHWSKCRISQNGDLLTLHLRHDLTHKWSLFLCE